VVLEAGGDPDAAGHTVESLLLDDNKETGILVEGGFSRVRRNRVLIADPAGVPSGATGILIRGASARVQANEFNDDRPGGGDGAFGFRLELAPGAVVERNSAAWRIAGGGTTGFWLEGNPGALVVRNTVQNAGTGTRCVGSPCKVRGGTTLSTGTPYVNIIDAGGNQ
jgi:hypothetical protein